VLAINMDGAGSARHTTISMDAAEQLL